MLKVYTILVCFPLVLQAQPFSKQEVESWQKQARQVTIIRDNWGVPHIYGQTDADAVFGLLYAQCEDDFARVEANYIEKLGRQAEVKGQGLIYEDLLHRILLDSAGARQDFDRAATWLKKLCQAFADGVNYYLATHPEVKPALLTRFEPWWPLLWTDGSIGAISTGGATQQEFKAFYSGTPAAAKSPRFGDDNDLGSNGFAFAPSRTASGNAILYINPHTTFYFRPEVHMVSQEGLNAYGAVTWGQFFVYQGFNEYCGWMHTSSQADVADLYAEEIKPQNRGFAYYYQEVWRPVAERLMSVFFRENDNLKSQKFRVFETHHGPVVAQREGKWLALKHHNRSMRGLEQSWLRTKATSFASFKQVMYMKENTSNNTVYADREGNIAYWHGNFMPRRNPAFDWSQPVDGTTSATEWQGVHMVDEMVTLYNPASGWIQNCNQTPFTSAGVSSPRREDYPIYMAPDAENFRGLNAVQVWSKATGLTLDKVIAGAYTRYLPAFDQLVPALHKAWNNRHNLSGERLSQLESLIHADAIQLLLDWDRTSDTASVATTLAIEWAQKLLPEINRISLSDPPISGFVEKTVELCRVATPEMLLEPFAQTIADLKERFGKWRIAWGELNRFQRLTGNLEEIYNDSLPSIAVGFAAATWGALPSYVSHTMPGTRRRYGVSGNSFVCAVEFGEQVKAKSLLAGGNSADPASPHFADQADMFSKGQFKDVFFYKEEVERNKKSTYHPGERPDR